MSDPVRAVQHALYRAAKADGRRFHALRDKVYRRDVLWRAWVNVRRNAGAAGIDRTTLADIEEYGATRLLDELAHDLREGSYRPLAGRIEDEALKLTGTNFIVHGRFAPHAVREGQLITGQQQHSGAAAARLVIEALGV